MDFFSQPQTNPNATHETIQAQRVVWNKGLNYYSEAQKAKQRQVGKRVMSCPEMRKIKSKLMSDTMKKSWASGTRDTSKGTYGRKPVVTPYGEFPSALTAAKTLAPKLGIKPCTIQSYIVRNSEKYAGWYYKGE
jgi:hypothetical protein